APKFLCMKVPVYAASVPPGIGLTSRILKLVAASQFITAKVTLAAVLRLIRRLSRDRAVCTATQLRAPCGRARAIQGRRSISLRDRLATRLIDGAPSAALPGWPHPWR